MAFALGAWAALKAGAGAARVGSRTAGAGGGRDEVLGGNGGRGEGIRGLSTLALLTLFLLVLQRIPETKW